MNGKVNRIRDLREMAGLSQQQLGDLIGVSKVTVSSLETGRMQLTRDYMSRIAAALRVTSIDLLIDDEQSNLIGGDEMRLVKAYRAAGSIQRDLIMRIAQPLESGD